MTLNVNQLLCDLPTGESRFRLTSLLARTTHFDIALGEDTHLDNKQVCIKAIRYTNPSDAAEVQHRRDDLERELQALTLPSHLLPEPLDWLHIENTRDFPTHKSQDNPFARSEPLLVYEYQAGKTLSETVRAAPDAIFDVPRALNFTRELALFLQSIHDGGYLFRDLSPDHIIVSLDDVIHIVGCGNMTPIKRLPSPLRLTADRPFIAPELRAPSHPDAFSVAADIYALGALLVLMLTGREPLKIPECPLDALSFHRIGELDPGLGQLIARMIDVNPARRFASMNALLKHLQPNTLPDPAHPDFHDVQLPSPWRLDEAETPTFNPLPTPGPLVVRTPDAQDAPVEKPQTITPITQPTEKPAAQPPESPQAAALAVVAQPPTQPSTQTALAKPDHARRTALVVRGVVGGTILIIFSIIMAALKLKGYF